MDKYKWNYPTNMWVGKNSIYDLGLACKNLNIKKRPISAVADNIEVRNAKTIKIKINKRIKFKLLYDKNRGLQKGVSAKHQYKSLLWNLLL